MNVERISVEKFLTAEYIHFVAAALSRSYEFNSPNHRNPAVQSRAGSAYGARSVLDLQYLFTDGTESSV